MDDADHAQRLEEKQRELALKNIRGQSSLKVSEKFCVECGVRIPEARRNLGGIKLCIDCQTDLERSQKRR